METTHNTPTNNKNDYHGPGVGWWERRHLHLNSRARGSRRQPVQLHNIEEHEYEHEHEHEEVKPGHHHFDEGRFHVDIVEEPSLDIPKKEPTEELGSPETSSNLSTTAAEPEPPPTADVPCTIPSTSPSTLNFLLDDSPHNIPNLCIGECQQIDLQPTDLLCLPDLKIISWHVSQEDATVPDFVPHADTEKRNKEEAQKIDEINKRRQALIKILKAAPHLKVIKDFHFDTDFDIVLTAGKIHTLQLLRISDAVRVDHLMEFVGARPTVKVLELVDSPRSNFTEHQKMSRPWPVIDTNFEDEEMNDRKKFSLAIRQLFLSTRDTLRVLDLTQFCSSFDFQMPCTLPWVNRLLLGSLNNPYTPCRLLPRHCNFVKIFPQLKILDCSRLQCHWNYYWDLYFPEPTTSDTVQQEDHRKSMVKTLIISDELTHHFMSKMRAHLCPNFTKLIIKSRSGQWDILDFILIKIFKYWQHLEYLQVFIDLEDLAMNFSFMEAGGGVNLDSALTGLREDSCEKLRIFGASKVSGGEDDAGLEEIVEGSGQQGGQRAVYFGDSVAMSPKMKHYLETVRPAITNLRSLRRLEIVLGHRYLGKLANQIQKNVAVTPPLSFVSWRYAFSLMNRLKVAILFDQKCPWGGEIMKMFEPLTPYVALRHRRERCCRRMRGKKFHNCHEWGQT